MEVEEWWCRYGSPWQNGSCSSAFIGNKHRNNPGIVWLGVLDLLWMPNGL